MKLTVSVDGREIPLRLERRGDEWIANGRAASVIEVEPGIYSVLYGGQSFEVQIQRLLEGGYAVNLRGDRFVLEVNDPRKLSRGPGKFSREGRQKIAAPMPGKVIRVLVAEGDLVEAGQGVVVVEAMKMQNELKAPKAGRVAALSAKEGSTVAAGEVLAVIE
jgi:biotin carboxyl carrier protein